MDLNKSSISSVKLMLRFQDSDKLGPIIEKEINLSKDDDYRIACPMRECVGGGFNLSESIKNPGQQEPQVCLGWQDRERINQHRCLCKLSYQVIS
jgi:hypothetical protein